MAITSALQADDAGSIPVARSIIILSRRTFLHWRFFIAWGYVVFIILMSSGYDLRPVMAAVLNFLQQRNEIL